ncbi:trypsin-like peptidase domain-containing protein [Luteipulveratus flavus]|uniref:Trypsin-like peptidase domain-containing protein n=1 Tax=Luteipulveratus flavus TaxID=3031728 RepID=A0ABT6C273_9MICO|nr:trypsin-like peptidase domain-containing protein [Luteipulveratus sp. YIM 133296]MDF8262716.1 trypsin-like peptidase domain-containing protein [Luteipulveratus sp. YIM 133296]
MTPDEQQPRQDDSTGPEHTQPIPPVPPARPSAPAGQHGTPAYGPPQGYAGQASAQGHPTAPHGAPGHQTAAQGAPWSAPQAPGSYGHGAHTPGYAAPGHAPTTTAPRSSNRRAPWVAVPLAALLAAGLASGGTYAATRSDNGGGATTAGPTTVVNANPADFADAGSVNWAATASKVSPSVVSITLKTSSGGDQGSGVILDTKGNIVTNHHVVADQGTLTVTLNDGRTYEATVVGTDASTDLAVIRLKNPPSGLKPVAIGDDKKLVVGQPVMAIGNPLGLSGTVTTGIVSALDRPVSTQQSSGGQGQQSDPFQQPQQQSTEAEPVVTNAVQTSAAINPGNSGGALVDGSGRLIGINSSIPNAGSSGSDQAGNIGIGFAIPVTVMKLVTGQLLSSGKAAHAQLGIRADTSQVKDGNATINGARVATVNSGSPAQKAGLKEGDVIVGIGGQSVESSTSLVGQVREYAVGQKVALTVVRDGQRQTITATLGADTSTS